MSRRSHRDAARRKLLSILSRDAIESLSGMERPWHANRKDLVEMIMGRWDHDGVEGAIDCVLRRAKDDQ